MCSKGKNSNYPRVKSLLKNYPNAVYQSLLGNTVINKNLVVLENHNVVLRRDYKSLSGKVKIIGGGGAGLEPAEVNYIGKGMLTAAVFGDLYSAPSAEEILIAIRELAADNSDGVLLLVKNYVGDRLNFGLALEKALSENLIVKMLILGDDAIEPILEKEGRKALAGSVLIYKIAGEMAEAEKKLDVIIEECRENILTDLATVSVSLPYCGKTFCESLNPFVEPDEIILNMGVYGQYGKKRINHNNISVIISIVLNEIYKFAQSNFDLNQSEVVLLINNNGSLSKIEESVLIFEASNQINQLGVKVKLLYSGNFMSTCNSNGFSITLLKINSPDTLMYLEAPTNATAWPQPFSLDKKMENFNLPSIIQPTFPHDKLDKARFETMNFQPVLSEKAVTALKQTTILAAEALISCEKQLNIIDSEAGDGDLGTTFKRGAEVLKKAVINNQINLTNPSKFLYDLSEICSRSMAGLTGALYSILFSSAANSFETALGITPEVCAAAFRSGVMAIKNYGKVELGDRTIIDVLWPAVNSFETGIATGQDIIEALYSAAATCEYKAEEIKDTRPPWQHRLNMQKPLVYTDAGAHAVTIWFRAIAFNEDTETEPPGIFLWKFLTEDECNEFLGEDHDQTDIMAFIEKKVGTDETFLLVLLNETFKYCRDKYLEDHRRISALIGTVYYTHIYFTASLWRSPSDVYYYFRESILCQSVECPPKSTEIFEPDEAREALLFFFETYIRNLPLTRLLLLPHYRLRLKVKEDLGELDRI